MCKRQSSKAIPVILLIGLLLLSLSACRSSQTRNNKESSSIILKSGPNELALYNYKTRKLHEVVNRKTETANYAYISKDQKNIITVIYATGGSSNESHEGLYKINLENGNRSLIYEGSSPKGMIAQLQLLDIFVRP